MTEKLWDFVDDFLEAAGGPLGVLMGFVLPLVGIVLSGSVLLGWWA